MNQGASASTMDTFILEYTKNSVEIYIYAWRTCFGCHQITKEKDNDIMSELHNNYHDNLQSCRVRAMYVAR